MAINIHRADALIHRLLQQQGSSLNHKTSPQQTEESGVSEKVTISEQARDAAVSESPSKLEPNLLQLYDPRGG
jgi:hypothetical protein